MKHQFTAGAGRAIAEAAGWSSREACSELEAPALLLGLLGESECRAALLLKRHGIDTEAVCRRWPTLGRVAKPVAPPDWEHPASDTAVDLDFPAPSFSADLEASFSALVARLHEFPRPLLLATEHLLLGLAAAEHEVALWLEEKGIDADALEADIRRRYGHQSPETPLRASPELTVPEIPLRAGGSAQQERQSRPQEHQASAQEREVPPHGQELSPHDQVRLIRVLDAALNRAREGLRVVEDYVRFVLDDAHLTAQMKRLRHDLAAAMAGVSIGRRLGARETQADVGTGVRTPSERRREDLPSVLAANFTRLQESLRTLEEFGKLLDPQVAAETEEIRYRAYTLQRAAQITVESLDRLALARLYVLIDGRSSAEEFAALARSLVEAGVDLLQLRDKRLGDRELLGRARLLREITQRGGALFVMNDRPDLAVLARADGVHVGQEELSVKDARTVVGPDSLIGVSTHSLDQARQAVLDGAGYIGVGPVFPSGTKRFEAFPGVELLRAVADEIRLPAFAIGGITPQNVNEVVAAGFRRIAVSGAVTTAHDPAAAVESLLAALAE